MIVQGAELSVKRQCELLDLNRTGVYYTPRPVCEEDLRLMRRIDELHLNHPFYGARRLARQLEQDSQFRALPPKPFAQFRDAQRRWDLS
jgi:putative transposase